MYCISCLATYSFQAVIDDLRTNVITRTLARIQRVYFCIKAAVKYVVDLFLG